MNNTFKLHVLPSLVAVVVLFLTSCTKKDPAIVGAGQGSVSAAANLDLPQPDNNHPLTSYVNISDSKQVEYLYYALSGVRPDYDKIAQNDWQDYRSTSDEFKKHEMLNAITPQIDARINAAKNQRYITFVTPVVLPSTVGPYDLTVMFQGMRLPSFFSGNAPAQIPYGSKFSDYGFYCANCNNFANLASFSFFPDQDRQNRLANSLTTTGIDETYNHKVKVYAFAQTTQKFAGHIETVITRIDLLTSDGKTVLASYPEN